MNEESNLARFIELQQVYLADANFDTFLPIVVIELNDSIDMHVLADGPDGPDVVELEFVVRPWAEHLAQDHDYYAAFKFDDQQLKILYRESGKSLETFMNART